MHIMSYTAARVNFASALDKIETDHIPAIITRQNDRKAALIGYDDYMSYVETAHLLVNPHNAEKLNKSIADMNMS